MADHRTTRDRDGSQIPLTLIHNPSNSQVSEHFKMSASAFSQQAAGESDGVIAVSGDHWLYAGDLVPEHRDQIEGSHAFS